MSDEQRNRKFLTKNHSHFLKKRLQSLPHFEQNLEIATPQYSEPFTETQKEFRTYDHYRSCQVSSMPKGVQRQLMSSKQSQDWNPYDPYQAV